MHKTRQSAAFALAVALIGLVATVAQAQWPREDRRDNRQIGSLLARIEQRSARFRNSIQQALNQSRLDSTRQEDKINQHVADFQQALAQLRGRYYRRAATDSDVQMVLERAARIETFMQRRQALSTAYREWELLRGDIDSLASAYNVAWNWDSSDTQGPSADGRLTGTFRLNQALSDNPRLIVERAVRDLPYSDRHRGAEMLLPRLDAPESLAIEQHGQTVTLASSRAPQLTFDADGRENVEQSPNSGRTVRVVARLNGNQLEISTSGDRASDFSVTFEPINNGRQLRVTRSLYSDRLNQPVVVRSIYDQVANVARWDVYTGSPDYSRNDPRDNRSAYGDSIVPDGVLIVGRLNEDLDTTRVRPGDRFTLTVVSPREYEGATIEGSVADTNRSGRVTGRAELALSFDSIRLRTGRTGRFEGTLESVRAANGETLRVDTEGTVADSSQTSRTIQRTAIGTAIGAIIGAVAGGGKGAAIGAGVGAGAGAGTVIAQGRNDLRLLSGSEITIRASAPNRRASR